MPNQLVHFMRAQILLGHWASGSFLPPERQLSKEYRVGRSTLREAIAQLIADGLIEIIPGEGTRVCSWLTNGSFDLYRSRYRPYVLAAEEQLLCTLAGETRNVPVMMLAHAIRRMLQPLAPFTDPGEELPRAQDRFRALLDAIERKDLAQTTALFDELCRLREPIFLALAAPAASAEAHSS